MYYGPSFVSVLMAIGQACIRTPSLRSKPVFFVIPATAIRPVLRSLQQARSYLLVSFVLSSGCTTGLEG